MKLDYGTQLSSSPIVLSIGTLVKPKLKDITDTTKGMSFNKFNYFEALIKMTPESFYTKIKGDEGKKYWDSLSEDEQDNLTLYQIVINDKQLLNDFLELFNFFFYETVIFKDGYFVLLNKNIDVDSDIVTQSDIRGVISDKIFLQVLNFISQICCIDNEEENIEEIKFKNSLAKKLFEKILKATKKQKEQQKGNVDFTLPNIISAVSNRHPTINPINVWELTVFQLIDTFNRMRTNSIFDMISRSVSIWGDKKKTFNVAFWYKNEYDKK